MLGFPTCTATAAASRGRREGRRRRRGRGHGHVARSALLWFKRPSDVQVNVRRLDLARRFSDGRQGRSELRSRIANLRDRILFVDPDPYVNARSR